MTLNKKDIIIILFLVLIFLCILPFFYLHQGLLLIDTGREFYIPQQILNGGVLYKDIFNIYGAFSYQFNALLFFIFGQKFSTLAIMGVLNSFLIIVTLYLLSREFLNKTISFLFSLFIMFALVFQTFLYNSNLTYSFAIVYALSSFLLSVLFLIKHIKTQKYIYIYLAFFFAGVSIANKYEFIFYIFILMYVLKGLGFKSILKSISCFVIIPFISYSILFFQGLNLNDVKNSIDLINKLINSEILKQFFLNIGISVKNNGIYGIFAILPILNVILLYINRKEIIKNKALLIFILCSILACAKSIFSMNINHMGVFLLPICFLTFLTIIKQEKLMPLLLIGIILIFAIDDFISLKDKNYLLETNKGNIFTYKKDGYPIKQISDYIKNNTNENNKVLILPEGAIINFITDRSGNNKYYNLSPLFYYDVFGEEQILNDFKQNMPDYIVILPIDNSEYGYKFFGKDYGQTLYNFIDENYKLAENLNGIKIFLKHIKF